MPWGPWLRSSPLPTPHPHQSCWMARLGCATWMFAFEESSFSEWNPFCYFHKGKSLETTQQRQPQNFYVRRGVGTLVKRRFEDEDVEKHIRLRKCQLPRLKSGELMETEGWEKLNSTQYTDTHTYITLSPGNHQRYLGLRNGNHKPLEGQLFGAQC